MEIFFFTFSIIIFMEKKFIKSRDNRVFTGILGGMAEYFSLSPRMLRICYFILTYIFHWMAIVYIILMFAMPEENDLYEDANSPVSGWNLPEPVKKVLVRFASSCSEIFSVLFKER